jgi:hypothetical protein
MSDEEEVADLRRRLARLEAKEEVLATFNAYTYSIDVGTVDTLFDRVFAPDATLQLVNFPPGTMRDSTLVGDQIRELYERFEAGPPFVKGGHHTTNVGVHVAEDLSSAELSAYFLTSRPKGVQGGMYRVRLVPTDAGRWVVAEMQITSAWGWEADTTATTEHIPAGKVWDDARPVTWGG